MRLMQGKWFLCLCLVVVLAGVIASFAERVWAAAGLDDVTLKRGEEKEAKAVITAERPSKLKIAVGVGSVVVAILVLKFL
jgi:hypothetical protein